MRSRPRGRHRAYWQIDKLGVVGRVVWILALVLALWGAAILDETPITPANGAAYGSVDCFEDEYRAMIIGEVVGSVGKPGEGVAWGEGPNTGRVFCVTVDDLDLSRWPVEYQTPPDQTETETTETIDIGDALAINPTTETRGGPR